jgi:hypothetical protein
MSDVDRAHRPPFTDAAHRIVACAGTDLVARLEKVWRVCAALRSSLALLSIHH